MEEVLVGSTGVREAVKSRKGAKRVLVDDDDESDDDEGMVFFPNAGGHGGHAGSAESSHELD